MDTTTVQDVPAAVPRPASAASSVRPGRDRPVLAAAVLLVVGQLGVRFWLLAGRSYYADDFDLLHLADRSSLLSPAYLLHDYVGHLMPGSLLLVGLVERAGPLEWEPALASLMVMQVLASLALLRLLRVLLGDRPALLVPLALGLFTPMTLGFTTWWAAAVNSMPLQIGLAWFLADALLLARTGRRRHAVSGTAALALTLAFYLKAVLLPGIAIGLVALVLLRDGERSPVAAAFRRARLLWAGSVVVLGCWAVAYLATRETDPVSGGTAEDVLVTVTTGFKALAPTVLGGPFAWKIRPPGTPIADLPTPLVVTGAVVLLCACLVTSVLLRGAPALWALVLATVGLGILMAALGRSGAGLGEVAPRAYRYFAIESVLFPVAVALLASLPARRVRTGAVVSPSAGFPRWAVPLTALATVSFVVGSLFSTVGYARAWERDRTASYLATARASLEAAGPAPMLDQPVPSDVLADWSYPGNLTSRVFAPLPDRPAFASSTSELRMLDDAGRLVPARVEPAARVLPGPDPACGYAVGAWQPSAVLPLDRTLVDGGWTVQLGYTATRDGVLSVALDDGEPLEVPVTEGTSAVFLRLTGHGSTLRLARLTEGLEVCVYGGVVGLTVI